MLQYKARQAHTMVELLLVVVLMLMFISAIIFQPPAANQLNDGVGHLRTLVVYARATAQINGRVVRVEFPENSPVTVKQQSDPLNVHAPFTDLPESAAYTEVINELVVVVSEQGGGDDSPVPVLVCYPDGSTELSTTLTVIARTDPGPQRATVQQIGLSIHVSQP